jgi:hypothetical protein
VTYADITADSLDGSSPPVSSTRPSAPVDYWQGAVATHSPDDESDIATAWRFFALPPQADEPPGAESGALHSPITETPWPTGWVQAICSYCSPCPGPGCGCGITVLAELSDLMWWHVVLKQGWWLTDPNRVDRIAIARMQIRGPVRGRSGHDDRHNFELRAAGAKIDALWLPATARRFAEAIGDAHSVPVTVSNRSGRDWFIELQPTLPHVPDTPDFVQTAFRRWGLGKWEAQGPDPSGTPVFLTPEHVRELAAGFRLGESGSDAASNVAPDPDDLMDDRRLAECHRSEAARTLTRILPALLAYQAARSAAGLDACRPAGRA